jgi:menaquinone-dependent protoporphyrinogen oxidase
MRVLIIYGSTEGQTRKISRFMEDVLQQKGHQVMISDAKSEPPSPEGFDAVLVGASVHIHKYQKVVKDYIIKHKDLLNDLKSAFFSVCMAVAREDKSEHEAVYKLTHDFFEQTGWKPFEEVYFAGAVKYTKYDYFKKFIMRLISKKAGGSTDISKDFEYTDWDQVKAFALNFVGPNE